MRRIAKVTFLPDGKRGKSIRGSTLLQAAGKLGVDLSSLCGGFGTCGKCRILVVEGGENLTEPTALETRFLGRPEISKGYRLACQAAVRGAGDLIVEVPAESRAGKQVLQIEGVETVVRLEPAVRKLVVEVPRPTLADPRSDAERLLTTLERRFGLKNVEIRLEGLRKLPAALRKGEWTISLTLRGKEIIDVEPGVKEAMLGFAFDLGTTKLAGYLVDLRTGGVLSVSSAVNPQIRFGEDVVSRVSYALKREGLRDLQRSAIEAINGLIGDACSEARASRSNLYELVVVGNTVMIHFFLGLSPTYLAQAPYPPVVQSAVDLKARELSIGMSPEGNVHLLPVIAGFVGADAVGVILSTEIYKSDVLTLAMDIGTNTEILLGDRSGLMVCSAASGPAFEGAHIKHGMRAATGAIEKIKIDPETFDVSYQTIGGVKPRGLCGSALVDAVAEASKTGIVDRSGKINLGLAPRVRVGEDGSPEFVVAWKDETSTGGDITLTQRDIRELQLAKAAIFAGIRVLMRKRRVGRGDLGKVLIAGAFGARIDPVSARTIGMFPAVPPQRVRHVGNAAGSGARMALVSRRARKLAAELAGKVRHVELAADPRFQKEFLDAMQLPHAYLKWF